MCSRDRLEEIVKRLVVNVVVWMRKDRGFLDDWGLLDVGL